jgi:hypothetical protein
MTAGGARSGYVLVVRQAIRIFEVGAGHAEGARGGVHLRHKAILAAADRLANRHRDVVGGVDEHHLRRASRPGHQEILTS